MSAGTFEGEEIRCGRGHVYLQPVGAREIGLPCPECGPSCGPYWRVVGVGSDDSAGWYDAPDVAVPGPNPMRERLFRKVTGRLIGSREWLPTWVEATP